MRELAYGLDLIRLERQAVGRIRLALAQLETVVLRRVVAGRDRGASVGIEFQRAPLSVSERIAKRVLDLIVAIVGILLLVVLWMAPEGVIGTLARFLRRIDPTRPRAGGFDLDAFLAVGSTGPGLAVERIGISFGGIKAAADVSFTAEPGRVTSVIGPNGAGKTTVLNMIGGFYRPDAGSIRLGRIELAGVSAWGAAGSGSD